MFGTEKEDFDRIRTEETTGLAGVKKGLVAERKEIFGGTKWGLWKCGKEEKVCPAESQPDRVNLFKDYKNEEHGLDRKDNPRGVLGARKNRGGLKDQLEGLRRQCDQ